MKQIIHYAVRRAIEDVWICFFVVLFVFAGGFSLSYSLVGSTEKRGNIHSKNSQEKSDDSASAAKSDISAIPTATPTPKWNQPPNMTDGYDVLSWKDEGEIIVIQKADNWTCTDGKDVIKIRWMGSYPGWQSISSTEVSPPDTTLVGFLLRQYQFVDGTPSIPGKMIKEELCKNYTERWYGAIQVGDKPIEYEHEFFYECELADVWEQKVNVDYFLSIQAVYKSSAPDFTWGWLNSAYADETPAVSKLGAKDYLYSKKASRTSQTGQTSQKDCG